MDYEINGFNEGLPDIECHAIIMVDASGTMGGKERKTDEEKHLCAARGVQKVLDAMDDPQYENACLSVAPFSANRGGVQIVSLLDCHKPYEAKTYTGNTDLQLWDGLSPQNCALGMGGGTPIGSALRCAREIGEQWVNASPGQVQRRAVIYLMSDGMNNVGPDGRDEKKAIEAFNASCEKGEIRLAAIGYFQSEESASGKLMDPEEEAGRQLLRDLPLNSAAYFESDNFTYIVGYILSTLALVMGQPA
jgi:hypothetical protein